jgi:hypothetical protein
MSMYLINVRCARAPPSHDELLSETNSLGLITDIFDLGRESCRMSVMRFILPDESVNTLVEK